MRIIILGGTGYLGSLFVRRLVEQEHDIVCCVRSTSSLQNLAQVQSRITLCLLENLESYLSSQPVFDCFVNTACRYPRNAASEADVFQANLFVPL